MLKASLAEENVFPALYGAPTQCVTETLRNFNDVLASLLYFSGHFYFSPTTLFPNTKY